MKGAILLFPLHDFMACAGTTLPCYLSASSSDSTDLNIKPFQRVLCQFAEQNGRQCALYVAQRVLCQSTEQNGRQCALYVAQRVLCQSTEQNGRQCALYVAQRVLCQSTEQNGRQCALYVALHNRTFVSAPTGTRKLLGSHPTHGPAISRFPTIFYLSTQTL